MEKLFLMIDNVEKLLTISPPLRDNDERLMANIWAKYIGKRDLNEMNAEDLLSSLAQGLLPSYESISRCRRKLQEECPNLRGDQWYKRHKRADNIRKEIVR